MSNLFLRMEEQLRIQKLKALKKVMAREKSKGIKSTSEIDIAARKIIEKNMKIKNIKEK